MASPVLRWQDAMPHRLLSGAARRGKWTLEEETYTAAIIQYFFSGVLPIPYGTTLRGFIAHLLHCDPMRVSKKLIPGSVLVGVRIDPKIGRRSYYPCEEHTPGLDAHRELAKHRLMQLRAQFIKSIEREEQQELAANAHVMPPHNEQRRWSLLQYERSETHESESGALRPPAMYLHPLDNDGATESCRPQPGSLPSLSDLLRQNRLRVPSKTLSPPATRILPPPLSYQHLHPSHASVFHYASPPRSSYDHIQPTVSTLPTPMTSPP